MLFRRHLVAQAALTATSELPLLALLLATVPPFTSAASIANDRDRLGTHLTGIPLYRTPGNLNVVKLGLGTPEQSGISLGVCESRMRSAAPNGEGRLLGGSVVG